MIVIKRIKNKYEDSVELQISNSTDTKESANKANIYADYDSNGWAGLELVDQIVDALKEIGKTDILVIDEEV